MLDLITLAVAKKYTDEHGTGGVSKDYVDSQISTIIGGLPPLAYDTIKKIGDYLETHESAYQALLTVLATKVDEPDNKGTVGQILSLVNDGDGGLDTIWRDETTYSNATTSVSGLMSAQDKSYLDGLVAAALTHVTVTGDEVTQELASYTEYRCTGGESGATAGIVTSLSLSLPQTIPTDYVSIIHFSTGANPDKTAFSIPASVLLCGTDVDIEDAEDGNGGTTQVYGFDVQGGMRYTIAFEYDGTYVRGYVTGVELI